MSAVQMRTLAVEGETPGLFSCSFGVAGDVAP